MAWSRRQKLLPWHPHGQLDTDDSGDEMLFPMSTATSTVEMDGEGGENAPTHENTCTGV